MRNAALRGGCEAGFGFGKRSCLCHHSRSVFLTSEGRCFEGGKEVASPGHRACPATGRSRLHLLHLPLGVADVCSQALRGAALAAAGSCQPGRCRRARLMPGSRHGGGCQPCPLCHQPGRRGWAGCPPRGSSGSSASSPGNSPSVATAEPPRGAGGLRPGRMKSGRPRRTPQVRVALAGRWLLPDAGRVPPASSGQPRGTGAVWGQMPPWAGWQLAPWAHGVAGSGQQSVWGAGAHPSLR